MYDQTITLNKTNICYICDLHKVAFVHILSLLSNFNFIKIVWMHALGCTFYTSGSTRPKSFSCQQNIGPKISIWSCTML